MELDGSANSFCEKGKEILDGKNYTDLGDMTFESSNPERVYNEIKEKIRQELKPYSKIICFGGDHSISFPIIETYSENFNNLNILHLDAHSDLYDNFDNNLYSHASPFARIMKKM